MMEETGEAQIETSKNKKLNRSVLDHFTRLSNENEATRLKFGQLLLKQIYSKDTPDQDNVELKYAVTRLVRGLGASKIPTKVGSYTTLVALLTLFPSITVAEILRCIKAQLQTGDTKSELGDVYTGQILACGALLHSNLFLKATHEEQALIIQQLFAAAKKRSYLTLATTSFIADLLLKVDHVEFSSTLWTLLRLEVVKPWGEQTIDGLYLLTLVMNRFHVLKDGLVKQHVGSELYTEENVKPICDILLNTAGLSTLNHPGYIAISEAIANSTILSQFITHLDAQLIKPNRNRILATALIFKTIAVSPQAALQLPDLLTHNFLRQALVHYDIQSSDPDKEFQEAMAKFFDIFSKEDVDDKQKVAVVKKLLFDPGTILFEKITKTKVLQQIVSGLGEEGVRKLSKAYRGVVAAHSERVVQDKTKPWVNSDRIYAAQLLVRLLNLLCVQGDLEWKKKQLTFLMNVSIVKQPKYTTIGSELSGALTDIFYRALDLKFTKLEDMRNVLLELVNHLAERLTPENYNEAFRTTTLSQDDFDIWQKTLATSVKLAKKSKKYALVFHILFLHMGLQLFKEKELAISSLKELFLCYERVRHKTEAYEQNEPEWIEVIIDLFLNLLSHNSHLLRNVIKSVFPHLCKYMTTSSLHQILAVLDPKHDTNPLSKGGEESEESSGDEEDANEDESANEEDDESSDDVGEPETLNDKLRMAVSKALGNDGYKTDEESVDLDDLDEVEGEKLNNALALAFKQFKPNRGKNKKQTKDEETLTHFRIRVLDLIESYIASEPSMLSCFEIMLPLLQTLEFTVRDPHQAPLRTRIKHCLGKLISLRKFSSCDEVTSEILCDLLSSLLTKGKKSALIFQDMSNEISECCAFIVKCAQNLCSNDATPKKTKKHIRSGVLKIIVDSLAMFFKNRDCLIPYSLFKSILILNWDGNFVLAPVISSYVFEDTTRPFRRSQALELLKIFYTNNRLHTNSDVFKEHVKEFESELCNKIVCLIDRFCANPQTTVIKERFIYHVFNLLRAMLIKEIRNDEIDWKSIGEKVREYRSHVTLSKDAKVSYNQLCGRLGIASPVKMKNQIVKLVADEDADELPKSKPKEEKQRKRHISTAESKKLKKKARDLRLQSMSEGFAENVVFSTASLVDLNAETNSNHLVNGKRASLVNGSSKKRLNSEQEEFELPPKKNKHK